MDASSAFEYLRVHIATEHQLKGNGKVALPQGRDGVKQGVLREPGHLGALRPQYKGYKESASHLVQAYTDRRKLATTLETGFLYSAGVVGLRHSDKSYTASTSLAPVFNSQTPDSSGTAAGARGSRCRRPSAAIVVCRAGAAAGQMSGAGAVVVPRGLE